MKKARRTKIVLIITGLLLLGVATGLVLFALKQNINLFYTPTELHAASIVESEIKVGGMVKPGSVNYRSEDATVSFIISDLHEEVTVKYKGVLPDLFKEGKGIVVHGRYKNGMVYASQVLAKHDENYMPPQFNLQEIKT